VLRGALEDFSTTSASQYLERPPGSTDEIPDAYARDHLRDPSRKRGPDRTR